ncbi:MAG: lipoprotein, partial [Geminicoccaceae bacterium]|nr:lipoprotein [Geminicoccaceae bacterium]
MRRRPLVVFLVSAALALAGCGRRGELRLPRREGEGRRPLELERPRPAPSPDERRAPPPAGLGTG